jgi:hypothetical protein
MSRGRSPPVEPGGRRAKPERPVESEKSELDRIAASLNDRPRQTLGWATPAEKMEELLR